MNGYASLLQTSQFCGTLNEETIEDILNYEYSDWTNKNEPQYVYVMLMPKNININGVEVNLSTPTCECIDRRDLNGKPCTMPYDALHYYDSVDPEFMAFTVIKKHPECKLTDEEYLQKGGKFELVKNTKAFAFESKENQENTLSNISNKIIDKAGISKEEKDPNIINLKVNNFVEQKNHYHFNKTIRSYYDDFDFD